MAKKGHRQHIILESTESGERETINDKEETYD
mgnify:CR=1 FL=1